MNITITGTATSTALRLRLHSVAARAVGVKGCGLVGFLRGFSKWLAVFLSGLVAVASRVVFQYCACVAG